MNQDYPVNLPIFVAGHWRSGEGRTTIPVENPVDETTLGELTAANENDIADAIASAKDGLAEWSRFSAWDRAVVLLKAERLIAGQQQRLARMLTLENGKPLADSSGELVRVRETLVYCAEEAKRTYGRVMPTRASDMVQYSYKRPVGPVAAFSPWNFPAVLAIRKAAAALAAGCSVILKPAEETPAICIELVGLLLEAGVPANALNLLFGNPAQISDALIESPVIQKISFTGSIPVGKLLAAKAGAYLKSVTMELGGHAPVIVYDDVDVAKVAGMCAGFKYRNAGQVCLAPSRFFVHESILDEFTKCLVQHAQAIKTGDGLDAATQMGPLANSRRMDAAQRLVCDAEALGGKVWTGGKRIGNKGYFFEPTVIGNLDPEAKILTEEPFCPVAPILGFAEDDDVISLANGNDVGLSAYAFTNRLDRAHEFSERIVAGWLGINDFTPLLADAPVNGLRNSGLGMEGGPEGLDAYLETRFLSQRMSL